VGGALHLHDAVQALDPLHARGCAFVYFGSIASVYAGSGLGCYAAANDFLHAFSQYQRRECGLSSRTLAWTSWRDLGISSRDKSLGFARWVDSMPARVGVAFMRGLLHATAASGAASVAAANATAHPDVLIGAKPREPEFGCLCANGPVALDTQCIFYTREQVPPIELCTADAVLCCVPELPWLPQEEAAAAAAGGVDLEALRERPLASLLGTKAAAPPETPEEEALVASWADLLSCDVGREDNFFDLGGSSVSWMGAVAYANSHFGIKLAAMEVMEFAMLKDFAAMVSSLKASGGGMGWQPKMCIERLRPVPPHGEDVAAGNEEEEEEEDGDEGDEDERDEDEDGKGEGRVPRRAVFFFPGATGTARCFQPLLACRLPPGVRAYGLLDVGLAGSVDSTHLAFDEIAKLYASAIVATEPNGPYVLVGHGVGAEWLWATAEALHERGASVASAVLLDLYCPSWAGGSVPAATLSSHPPAAAAEGEVAVGGGAGGLVRNLALSLKRSLGSMLPMFASRSSTAAADTAAMADPSARRERLATAFAEWSEAEDHVWDFSVRMHMLEGWPGLLSSRSELEPNALPPRCEDALHHLINLAKESGIGVDKAKRAARCVAESTLRSLPFRPNPMPLSTRVVLVGVWRGDASPPMVADGQMGLGVEGDQPARILHVKLADRPTAGSSSADRSDELSVKGLAEQPGLLAHLRCLQDPAFLTAASSAIFD